LELIDEGEEGLMAPFDGMIAASPWGSALTSLGLGVLFGIALERSGFGTAKKLTAQFYLYDMSVFKVMFTAIVTAMLLLFLSVSFGWVDFDRVWINPTYWHSQILGGFIFGMGFVMGGYCPGTALVALANLKWDALVFVGGLLFGIAVFAFSMPFFEDFWQHAGAVGRLTLPEFLGVPTPLVVMGVTLMALGCFVGAGYVERWASERRSHARGGGR
jgi:hypothetical protein